VEKYFDFIVLYYVSEWFLDVWISPDSNTLRRGVEEYRRRSLRRLSFGSERMNVN